MMKNLLRFRSLKGLMALFAALLFVSPSFAQDPFPTTQIDFEVDNLPYQITSANTVAVVKDESTDPKIKYKGAVVIPATVEYNGVTYKVTEIAREAFMMAEELTEVTIGENVTTIGIAAFFNCKRLAYLDVPANVRTIQMGAFMSCEGMQELNFEEGIRVINGGAFVQCGFQHVTLPASLRQIENGILAYCQNLTKISVAEGNTILKADENGVLYNIDGTILMQYPAGNPAKEYTIPAEVTTLYESSFEGANFLTKITLPTTLKTIQTSVFYGCKNLANIVCESTVPWVLPDESVFDVTSYTRTILRVPDEAVTAYKEAEVWKNFKEIMGFNDVDIDRLVIEPSSVRILRGKTFQLDLTILPENSTYKNVEWSSENEDVAIVDQKGLVEAIEPGTVLISCATPSGQVRSACTVTVYDESDEGAVEEIEGASSLKVIRSGKGILVSGVETPIRIYTANGVEVYAGNGGYIALSSGIYFVKADGRTVKVIL